jgi:hypothetical protein
VREDHLKPQDSPTWVRRCSSFRECVLYTNTLRLSLAISSVDYCRILLVPPTLCDLQVSPVPPGTNVRPLVLSALITARSENSSLVVKPLALSLVPSEYTLSVFAEETSSTVRSVLMAETLHGAVKIPLARLGSSLL